MWGDKMYKILTFKSLAIFSSFVCVAMIITALSNTFLPDTEVFSDNEKEVVIIMYHQISENKNLWGDYVIPESLLKEDLEYLKRNNFTPVKLQELLDFCNGKKDLPEKPVVITFDDGQRSFLTKVVPLLEEYNFPAVINVVGSLVDLYTENGDTDDRYAYLNKNDLKILSENSLVEIGHHSYNCHSLGSRRGLGKTYGESNSEYLTKMKADIGKLNKSLLSDIGITPYILAYPYGIRNNLLSELVKDMGFTVTLGCRECVNLISQGDELFDLGRFNRPYGKSSSAFFNEITG